ncbi:MAG: hypothetical protein Q7R94_00250 [bacterium]|nr:hypothetical protein [bacterium]
MRKLLVISRWSLVVCLLLVASLAFAQVKINPNIPGVSDTEKNPCAIVFGFYKYALMIGGILAFGAVVYGGVKYTLAAGNPSGQSEGKEWVKGALLGLLLLAASYLVLNTINPDITKCTLTELADLPPVPISPTSTTAYNCIPTVGESGKCNSAVGACSESPSILTARTCIATKLPGSAITATTGGTHVCNPPSSISCHFGGTSCNDGGHAIDFVKPPGKTWAQAKTDAQGCAGLSCYCEGRVTPGGAIFRDSTCTDARIDHIHCNVGSCGCN